ncbi:MAG: hypothetical protein ABW209_06700 [Pseudomonas caspiana]
MDKWFCVAVVADMQAAERERGQAQVRENANFTHKKTGAMAGFFVFKLH